MVDLRRTYGDRKLVISGFNTIVFVAEIEKQFSGELVPVLYLQGTAMPLTRIRHWYKDTQITDVNIVPTLTRALDHPSNQGTVTSSVAEFVSGGAKNIRPTGPFV
ncbi:MAG: hypothetical protein Q8P65_01020 [bacterium]|nr:hypothetical protein [bacterium]